MNEIAIEPARRSDVEAVLSLLRSQKLPVDDLESHLDTTLVARRNGAIVGSVAVEVYADGGLLRSVAVAADAQGHGVGRKLTEAAFSMAEARGISTLYLLTTTAEHYFPKLGFERITRADVPPSVQASVEFTSACPASAVVMRRRS
jgi:amino-acid N-acetyltransferase